MDKEKAQEIKEEIKEEVKGEIEEFKEVGATEWVKSNPRTAVGIAVVVIIVVVLFVSL